MVHTPQKPVPESMRHESARILLFIVLALPFCLLLLALVGITLSESVWAMQLLIGVGILCACGILSLGAGEEAPNYAWYGVGFFLGAVGLYALWTYSETEGLAHTISATLSLVAIIVLKKDLLGK